MLLVLALERLRDLDRRTEAEAAARSSRVALRDFRTLFRQLVVVVVAAATHGCGGVGCCRCCLEVERPRCFSLKGMSCNSYFGGN